MAHGNSGIWTLDGGEILRTAKCPICGELVTGERAEDSLSYLQPRSSSQAQGYKRRHICGVCLAQLLDSAPSELPLEGASTRGAEYTWEVYIPGKPWEACQNAHGAFADCGWYPYWGTAKRGVYWRKRLANCKRTGVFGSLQKMGYDSIVRCEVAWGGESRLVETRFATWADLLALIHEAEESLGLVNYWL